MSEASAAPEVRQRILDILPQKPPFRFIDEIVEMSEERVVGRYRFDPDHFFYAGHFPGRPITPGVILLEAMAQTAVVALGIYLTLKEQERDPSLDPSRFTTMFAECTAEFLRPVLPGTVVTVEGQRQLWRRRKLRALAKMYLPDGEVAATAILAGQGVELG